MPLRSFPTLLALSLTAHAGTLQVGPASPFITIQSAIEAASPGDVIQVAPGIYPENIVISKSPLTLLGAKTGEDARGRIAGSPDPGVESIISPLTGPAVAIDSGAGPITISGFQMTASPGENSGVVASASASAPGLLFSENEIRVRGGAAGAAIRLTHDAENATFGENRFVAGGSSAFTVIFGGSGSFDGLHFKSNDVVRDGVPFGTGWFSEGDENIGPSNLRTPEITGNRFAGHALGFHGGVPSIVSCEISGNIFSGNFGGMEAGPTGSTISGNTWQANTGYGFKLISASANEIGPNTFAGNGGRDLVIAGDSTFSLPAGGTIELPTLTLDAGSSLSIRNGGTSIGSITMDPQSSLEVANGGLTFTDGGDHTIAGSFTFFNSLGSLEISADTTFSGQTLGLISDIHVSDGVTLFVTGGLVLDGCTLDGGGTFNIEVSPAADFAMIRCNVSSASIALDGGGFEIRDNRFDNSTIQVAATSAGGAVYHNVFNDGLASLTIGPGADVQTSRDGWGNVTDAESVRNELSLTFNPPSQPDRTLDAAGNLYLQPGDPLAVDFNVGHLQGKAQAVEAIFGFSTALLSPVSIDPAGDWTNSLYEFSDSTSALGRINRTSGLAFTHADPDGSPDGGTITSILLATNAAEGTTRFFFRSPTPGDAPLVATRITASDGGTPFFIAAPFTRNTSILTIDGTPPEFGPASSATQLRNASPVDLLQTGILTRQGTVTITFDARDELAGIDDDDVSVNIRGTSSLIAGTFVSATAVDIGGETFTRYTFQAQIGPSEPNGLYDIDATVIDRSGNKAGLAIGAVEIDKNRIVATVAPQGLTPAVLIRNVTFIATDAIGTLLATWTLPVTFNGGLGTADIEEVPDAAAFISAKMDWNLRRRLPAALDVSGQATVSFTGSSELKGGDFNGNNVVNSGDYNILGTIFPGVNPAADITGSGTVNSADYNIFAENWLTAGDPP